MLNTSSRGTVVSVETITVAADYTMTATIHDTGIVTIVDSYGMEVTETIAAYTVRCNAAIAAGATIA